MIKPIASGFYIALNSKPQVETRGYNMAAPPAPFIRLNIYYEVSLSDESASTQAAIL